MGTGDYIESTNHFDMITTVMLMEWVCSRRSMALSEVAVEETCVEF